MIVVKMKQFAGESWKLVRMITGGPWKWLLRRPMVSSFFGLPGGTSWEAAAGESVGGCLYHLSHQGSPEVASFIVPCSCRSGGTHSQGQTRPVSVHPLNTQQHSSFLSSKPVVPSPLPEQPGSPVASRPRVLTVPKAKSACAKGVAAGASLVGRGLLLLTFFRTACALQK